MPLSLGRGSPDQKRLKTPGIDGPIIDLTVSVPVNLHPELAGGGGVPPFESGSSPGFYLHPFLGVFPSQ